MPKLNGRLPQYRLHRRSGQAIVTLNNRDRNLGEFGSEASRQECDRLIAKWLSNGRRTPEPAIADQLVTAYGADALQLMAKHPGVGAKLAETLGGDIAALPVRERGRLLDAI